MSSSSYLTYGLIGTLVGAGVGGGIGLLKVYFDNRPSSTNNTNNNNNNQQGMVEGGENGNGNGNANTTSTFDPSKYEYIKMDPVAIEALSRFYLYYSIIGREFDTIANNLNKLIGLQVSINSGNIQPYFPYRATTYDTHIQNALAACKSKIRNISLPAWSEDESSIKKISSDYVYNINQDVSHHLLTRRV